MDGKWYQNQFIFYANYLANHGGKLNLFFLVHYLPTNSSQVGCQYVNSQNNPSLPMYKL